jgi:hypothetical protein
MDNKILLSIVLSVLIVFGLVYIYIFTTIDVKIITNKKYIEDDYEIIKKDLLKTLIDNNINYSDVNITKYNDDMTQIIFKSKTNRLSISDILYINNIVNLLKTKSEVIKKYGLKSSDEYLKNSVKINLVYILNKTYVDSEQDIIKKEISNVLTDENIYDFDIIIEKNSDNNRLVKLNIDYYKTDLFTEKDLLNLIDTKFLTSLFSEYNFISKTNYDSNNTNIIYEFIINVKYKDQNILNEIKNIMRIKDVNNITITLDKYIDKNTYMKLDIFYNKHKNFDDKELLRIIDLNFSQNSLLKKYSLTLKSEYDKNLYHLDLEYLLNKPYDKEDLNELETQLLSLVLLDKSINDANVIFDKYINGIIHIKILIFYNIKVLDTKIVLNNFLKNIKDFKNNLQLNSGITMNLISDVELKTDKKEIEYIYTEKYTSRGYYDPNKYKPDGSPDLSFEDILDKCNNDSSCFGVQEIDGAYNICNSINKRIYGTIYNGMYIIKTKKSKIPQPVSYTEPEKDKILKNSKDIEYINRKDKTCDELLYINDTTGLTLDELITKCGNDKNVGGFNRPCSGIKIKNRQDGSQDIFACKNIFNSKQNPSLDGQEFSVFLQNQIPPENKIFNIGKQNEEFKTDKNIDYVFKNDKICMLKGPLQRAGLTLNQTMDLCNETLNINGLNKTCKGILIGKDKTDSNLQVVSACLEYQNNLNPSIPVNTNNYIFKKDLPIDNIKYTLPDFSKQFDKIEGKTVDNIDYLLTNTLMCNGNLYDLNGAPTLDEAIKKCDNEKNINRNDCIGLKFTNNADGSQTVSACTKENIYTQRDYDNKNKSYFLKNKLPFVRYPKLNYPNNSETGVINDKTTSGLDYVYTNKVNCSATSGGVPSYFNDLDINQALDECKKIKNANGRGKQCVGLSIYDNEDGFQVKEMCTDLQEGPAFRGYDVNGKAIETPNLYLIKSMVPEIL